MGIEYSPLNHLSRSINLQRSEQNGLNGLFSQTTSFEQVGHLTIIIIQTRKAGDGIRTRDSKLGKLELYP